MNTWVRIIVLIGGIITLGFGVWHIFVPHLYGWMPYLKGLPEELSRGITATNFFFGVSLAILGAITIVLTVWFNTNLPFIRIWLWVMSGLWVLRVAHQIVKPQGKMIPGLTWIMLAVFIVTCLLFVLPAIVSSKS